MSYSVKKVTQIRGREGLGYNATLCRDGKVVALAIDDASGGPVWFEWADHKAPRVEGSFKMYDDTIAKRQMTPEEAKFEAHLMTLPPVMYYGKPLGVSDGMFLEGLMMTAKVEDRIKKLLKSHVVLLERGRIAQVKPRAGHTVAMIIPAMKTQYPNAKILNEMSVEEAIAIARPLLMPE